MLIRMWKKFQNCFEKSFERIQEDPTERDNGEKQSWQIFLITYIFFFNDKFKLYTMQSTLNKVYT